MFRPHSLIKLQISSYFFKWRRFFCVMTESKQKPRNSIAKVNRVHLSSFSRKIYIKKNFLVNFFARG